MFNYLNITDSEPLPSPSEVLKKLPTSSSQTHFIQEERKIIQNILNGEDSRQLMIVGPCSIHDVHAAKEYAGKLLELAREISDTCHVVMRVYFEKPRTTRGWKGFLYDPFLDGSYNITAGLTLARQLLLDLAEMGIPTAAEFLDPLSFYYFGDLVSWGCIGARTTSSQTHRQLASGLPMPIAFKNSTDGNIDVAINGIICASEPHTFIGMNASGQVSSVTTAGNPCGHIVLRGAENATNYDPQSIMHALNLLEQARLPQRLLIDCSHDNSFRQYKQQQNVFQAVINQIIEGNQNIRGILLESHLFPGNQPFVTNPTQLKYAVSVTDSCLDWPTTEHLLLWGHKRLKECDAFQHQPIRRRSALSKSL